VNEWTRSSRVNPSWANKEDGPEKIRRKNEKKRKGKRRKKRKNSFPLFPYLQEDAVRLKVQFPVAIKYFDGMLSCESGFFNTSNLPTEAGPLRLQVSGVTGIQLFISL
jgi:hypothetical protein